MDQNIINIILGMLALLIGAAATYFKSNTKLNSKVVEYIAEAEEVYKDSIKAGGQKFEWVVTQLYNLLPAPLRIVFTRQLIGVIVQNAFNSIQQYAKSQLDKAIEKAVK